MTSSRAGSADQPCRTSARVAARASLKQMSRGAGTGARLNTSPVIQHYVLFPFCRGKLRDMDPSCIPPVAGRAGMGHWQPVLSHHRPWTPQRWSGRPRSLSINKVNSDSIPHLRFGNIERMALRIIVSPSHEFQGNCYS